MATAYTFFTRSYNHSLSYNLELQLNSSKILLGFLGVRLHGDITRLPPCWANLIGILLYILHCLQGAHGLLNATPKGQVVDGGMLDHALHTTSHKFSKPLNVQTQSHTFS